MASSEMNGSLIRAKVLRHGIVNFSGQGDRRPYANIPGVPTECPLVL